MRSRALARKVFWSRLRRAAHANEPPEATVKFCATAEAPSRPLVAWWWFFVVCALPLCANGQARFIDEQAGIGSLFQAMDERLSLMPAVAANKWHSGAPITDPERERVVAQNAGDLASSMGLDREAVRALFELQIAVARDVQSGLHGRWRDRGYDFGTEVPSLQTTIRPRLDQITGEILRGCISRRRSGTPMQGVSKMRTGLRPARERVIAAVAAVQRAPAPVLDRIARVARPAHRDDRRLRAVQPRARWNPDGIGHRSRRAAGREPWRRAGFRAHDVENPARGSAARRVRSRDRRHLGDAGA